MSIRIRRLSGVVSVLASLCIAAPASARPDRSAGAAPAVTPPALGIAKAFGSTSTGTGTSLGARPTTILGSAWTADNSPISQARVRLRNVITGRIEAAAIADNAGQFTFDHVEGGSYLVELVNDADRIRVVGHVFTIAPGETVATFVRLGTKVPWVNNLFTNSVSAVSSTAASQGITAIAPVARPSSANK